MCTMRILPPFWVSISVLSLFLFLLLALSVFLSVFALSGRSLGGNHCFCGSPSDIAAAGSRKVPLAECSPSNCSMHYGDGCACTGNPAEHCGTPTRAIAYGFTCK